MKMLREKLYMKFSNELYDSMLEQLDEPARKVVDAEARITPALTVLQATSVVLHNPNE